MYSLIISFLCIGSYIVCDPMRLALQPADFHWWQAITYAFAHAGSLHLALNLLALVSFGPALEREWGRYRFLLAYFASVGLGAAAHMLVSQQPLVGASAGIFGLFAAFVIANPKKRVTSIFLIDMPAWMVLAAYAALSAAAVAFHLAGGIAHAAHLGGMAVGVSFALANKKPR